jgi:predicted SnoaL-like aldol condensation-catalyzing enzyme
MPEFTTKFPRAEVEEALRRYLECGAERRDWRAWAETLTEDAVYVQHEERSHRGRAAIRAFIVEAMAQVPSMTFPLEWYMIDGNRCVLYLHNDLPDPKGGSPHRFSNVTILYYAGNGQFDYMEDVINTAYVDKVVGAYFKAGGKG